MSAGKAGRNLKVYFPRARLLNTHWEQASFLVLRDKPLKTFQGVLRRSQPEEIHPTSLQTPTLRTRARFSERDETGQEGRQRSLQQTKP